EAAARLLLASCLEASPRAAAPQDEHPITVLELGAGSGLFARLLLDRFRDLCAEIGRDFYKRLTYIVSDASPATASQRDEPAPFATHAGRVTCVVAGALDPELSG